MTNSSAFEDLQTFLRSLRRQRNEIVPEMQRTYNDRRQQALALRNIGKKSIEECRSLRRQLDEKKSRLKDSEARYKYKNSVSKRLSVTTKAVVESKMKEVNTAFYQATVRYEEKCEISMENFRKIPQKYAPGNLVKEMNTYKKKASAAKAEMAKLRDELVHLRSIIETKTKEDLIMEDLIKITKTNNKLDQKMEELQRQFNDVYQNKEKLSEDLMSLNEKLG